MRVIAHTVGVAVVMGLSCSPSIGGVHVRLSWSTAGPGQRLAFGWTVAALAVAIAAMLVLMAVEVSR